MVTAAVAISTDTSSSSSEVKPWLRPERMSLKGLTAEQKCERREYLLNRWKKNNPDKVKKGHDKWSEKRRAEREELKQLRQKVAKADPSSEKKDHPLFVH